MRIKKLEETVTISSKGQITIPSKLRRKLKMNEGEKLLIFDVEGGLRLARIPKLSEMAGIDEILFRGRKPSKELEAMRHEWARELEERIKRKNRRSESR